MNRTNVGKDPSKDFNACDDFFVLVVSCHIIAAALTMLQMKSLNDTPGEDCLSNAQSIWMLPANDRRATLDKVCMQVIDSFVDLSFDDKEEDDEKEDDSSTETDGVTEYGKQVLGLGCFYLEIADAIREGDGERVLRCWRYLLPIFLGSHRTNYTCEVLNMLYQHTYALPPRLSAELLWSRFVNVHGRPGKNIPADLHMEHLNRLAKGAMKNLGANKTEKAISRVGRALGTLGPLLDHFDGENAIIPVSGAHCRASTDKDRNIIVGELVRTKVFTTVTGRKHQTFPHPRDVLHAKTREEILQWMTTRLRTHHVK